MARQAEAEREKRAKILHADGEFQASARLAITADSSTIYATDFGARALSRLDFFNLPRDGFSGRI